MVEMAEIFRRYGPSYRGKYGDKMLPSHRKAMRDIERCRTAELGGHVYSCEECEQTQYQYHSCRNRHCPKCQNDKAQQWLEKQQDLLLATPYFMLTFTLPDELRRSVRSHQTLFYDLLFRTSAAATQQLGQDARFVGGQMAMVGVLHTWGRNLAYHPHLHYVIPAGGLAPDGQTWLPARENFLLPVKALSRIFRAKFRDLLRKRDPASFSEVPPEVWEKAWVVHCQPVGKGLGAFRYLAPYIFRVAISNNRILKLTSGKVTFRYRTSDTGKLKTCTLPAEEFIRRFLQHVLPRGFAKSATMASWPLGAASDWRLCANNSADSLPTHPWVLQPMAETSKPPSEARQMSQCPAKSSRVPRAGGSCDDGQFVPSNHELAGAVPLDG